MEADGGHGYAVITFAEKLVCDYSGISFFQLEQLPVDEFRLLLRDAYVYQLDKTEKGREYLNKCWVLEQTEPDRGRLREVFGKEERE